MHTQKKLCMSLILTTKHPEPKGRIDEMLQAEFFRPELLPHDAFHDTKFPQKSQGVS